VRYRMGAASALRAIRIEPVVASAIVPARKGEGAVAQRRRSSTCSEHIRGSAINW